MEGFPAVFYSEPAVLGLLANAVSAFLVCMQNFSLFHTSVKPGGVENILAGATLGLTTSNDGGFTAGAIAFLIVNAFLIVLAAQANIVLLLVTLLMEAVIVCFMLFTLESLPLPLEIAVLSVLSALCLYGFLASLANCIFNKELIFMGPAIYKKKELKKNDEICESCLLPSSRRTSGLRTIAEILEGGGVCGIPTDTVYALAASCKHPDAISRIYTIKERPSEKPICICISNLEQLRVLRPPFSPLLWRFMDSVYPGGISCIVKKGEWLRRLGVGAAYDKVGTPDSIMIRVPDHSVTAHLTDMTGPLAITSANPSGESDSTHHDMVTTRLSYKLDAVLCDGYSNELVGSTVVNCTKIDEGGITILREGCVSAARIMQLFEHAKNTVDVL
ncbi:putative threonylcarbamoyl-AMP synthase isoform 2-T2 [Discoglossus pictus]